MVGTVALVLAACNPVQGPPTRTPGPSSSPTTADACHQDSVTYCVLNPAVTQATIKQTICASGWTKTIRPPATFTDNLKRQQMAAEHLTGSASSYEEDHRMPLELGGAPSEWLNLSPELGASPNSKDRDEDALHKQVCAGTLALVAAQQALVAKWLAAYPGYRQ